MTDYCHEDYHTFSGTKESACHNERFLLGSNDIANEMKDEGSYSSLP